MASVIDEVALGKIFSHDLVFPLPIIIPPILLTRLSSVGAPEAALTKELVSPCFYN
jgi:hypothetical protein